MRVASAPEGSCSFALQQGAVGCLIAVGYRLGRELRRHMATAGRALNPGRGMFEEFIESQHGGTGKREPAHEREMAGRLVLTVWASW